MVVLYCTNRPRAFLAWQRGYKLLNPDIEVHMVQHPSSARGYRNAYYIMGEGYGALPADTRRYVEQRYKELH